MSELNNRLEARLAREWQQRGPLAWALMPFACVFGAVAAARRAAFSFGWLKSVRIGVPVVVVGNVTVGGTGKTPTVIALVEALRAAGFSPSWPMPPRAARGSPWAIAPTICSIPAPLASPRESRPRAACWR